MPIIKQRSQLAAKIETVSGTAETLTATEAAFNVFDLQMQANISMQERPGNGSFSFLPAISDMRQATVSFKTEIYGTGTGTVPAWASTFLPACGWTAAAGVFTPKSESPGTNVKTLTMAHYVDGYRVLMRGCAGTFKIVAETGKIAMIEWTFQGAYVDLTTQTLLAPTYPTTLPFRVANAPFSWGSWQPCCGRIEIDAGNQVALRPCQTQADGSGIAAAHINGRRVTISMDPEMVTPSGGATPWADWTGHTERAFSLELQDATDQITIAAPKAQILNAQQADRGGIVTANITLGANRNSAAGNDELSLTFAAYSAP